MDQQAANYVNEHPEVYDGNKDFITLDFVDRTLFDEGISLIEEAKRTINSHISYVKKRKTAIAKTFISIYPHTLTI